MSNSSVDIPYSKSGAPLSKASSCFNKPNFAYSWVYISLICSVWFIESLDIFRPIRIHRLGFCSVILSLDVALIKAFKVWKHSVHTSSRPTTYDRFTRCCRWIEQRSEQVPAWCSFSQLHYPQAQQHHGLYIRYANSPNTNDQWCSSWRWFNSIFELEGSFFTTTRLHGLGITGRVRDWTMRFCNSLTNPTLGPWLLTYVNRLHIFSHGPLFWDSRYLLGVSSQ